MKRYPQVKILSYEELTKSEKILVWKVHYREEKLYFRFGGQLYTYDDMRYTEGYSGLANWNRMLFTAYSGGIVARVAPDKDTHLQIALFSCNY
jgi:hypothetical protein